MVRSEALVFLLLHQFHPGVREHRGYYDPFPWWQIPGP